MKKFSFETQSYNFRTQSYNFRDVVANNIIFHHTNICLAWSLRISLVNAGICLSHCISLRKMLNVHVLVNPMSPVRTLNVYCSDQLVLIRTNSVQNVTHL